MTVRRLPPVELRSVENHDPARRQVRVPDGTRWLVERAPADSPDGSVQFLVNVPPGVFSPPPHIHPEATDSYEVLEGAFTVKVDGNSHTLKKGEKLDVPPRTVHTLANRSGAEALVRNVHQPANRLDEFVAHADRLMRARKLTKIKDLRVPILFSMLTLEYPDTLIPDPPVRAGGVAPTGGRRRVACSGAEERGRE